MKNLHAPLQSIDDASYITGLSRSSIRKGCRAGTIPHIKSGSKYLVNVPLLLEQINATSAEQIRDDGNRTS